MRVDPYTTLGLACKIFHGAAVGGIPQDLKFAGEKSSLRIGDEVTIREYVTLHRGTGEGGVTRIGNQTLLMNYVHVAHNCEIGNHVILSNGVQLAGHVSIGDHVILGGIIPVHQFVKIGEHAFIGGGYRVAQDVPPYILAAGEPLRYCGLNLVGLKRRSFTEERISQMENAYKLIYRSHLTLSSALTRIREEMKLEREILSIVNFFEASERGVIR